MADFGAVLRKTIDGLSENTPEMRAKVYEKARATIDAKLAAASPQPSPAVAERQKQSLEDAIAAVEADYAGQSDETAENEPAEGAFERLLSDPETGDGAGTQENDSAPDGREASPAAAPPRRSRTGLVITLILLVVLAGAAYAVWMNKDAFMTALGIDQVMAPAIEESDEQPAAGEVADGGQVDEAPETAEAPAGEDGQAAADGGDASGQSGETPEKFTQRLMPDGREIDEGPAGGESTIGEGTSVAAATGDSGATATDSTPAADAEGVDDASGSGEAAEAAVPVGQKAIFYEERTRSAEGSAQEGAVVWSLVEEPPSEGLPPEPVIEGEATIPGKGIQLKLTIRRNADESLPASHIIEMIFLAPDDFEGGGIENVLRIAMKGSEQETGNPLLGIPAKIDSGFFLFALSDTPADMETNLTLLRRQRWIDISIVYESGRRALIAMEKGIPGEKVFNDAITAWQSGSSD